MNPRAKPLIRLLARWIVEDHQAGRLPVMNWTAIHEAGHAVARYRLHGNSRYIGDLSIVPRKGNAGHALQEIEWDCNSESMLNEVLILCSGYAACVAAGLNPDQAKEGCDSDFEKAELIIGDWKLKSIDVQIAAATALMDQPKNRRAVQRLADELGQHQILRSEEIDVLIEVADSAISEEDLARFRIKLDATRGAR